MASESNPAQASSNSTSQAPAQSQDSASATQEARQSITRLAALFEEPNPQTASVPDASEDASKDTLENALLTRQARPSGTPNPQLAKALEAASAQHTPAQSASAPAASQENTGVANSAAAPSAADGQSPGDHQVSGKPEPDTEVSQETSQTQGAEETASPAQLSPEQQVRIKREDDHLALIFPREQTVANPEVTVDFVDSELWQQLQQRLSGSERFWQDDTPVHLNAQNHLLDARQLQELGEALDRFDLKLTRISTNRRQTAVAAATSGFSVDQGAELPKLLPLTKEKGADAKSAKKTLVAEPLYLQTTVRSGAEIRHPGSVIIMGDLNPGSSVVADGDILIWGRLRGIAHAGAGGNPDSIILAMKLEPTQLRIANAVARVPEPTAGPAMPEVAYVTAKGDIRIAEAAGFTRPRR